MKSLLAALLLFGFLTTAARAQQDADEKYLSVYALIQQADSLAASGQPQQALDGYQQAQAALAGLHGGYPDWNPRIVIFRQKYLTAKIDALKAQLPPPAPAAAPVAASAPAGASPAPEGASATPAAAGASAPADWADQLAALRAQLQTAGADNATLAAKLKEALAAQPAAMDPRELAAARDQVRDLLKQNELLKTTLEQEKKDHANDSRLQQLAKITKQLDKANDQLAAQQKRADKLAAENDANLKKYLASDKALTALREENEVIHRQLNEATNALPKVQADLAAANTRIETLQTEVKTRTADAKQLQKQLKAAAKSDALAKSLSDLAAANTRIDTLSAEVKARTADAEKLQKQLKAAAKSSEPIEKLKAELAAAHLSADALRTDLDAKTTEAAALQKQVKAFDKSDRPVQKLKQQLAEAQAATQAAITEKDALQARIRELQASQLGTAPAATGDATARLNDLTRERDELLAQLGEANRKLASHKDRKEDAAVQIAQLTSDLAAAKAQINSLTLPAVPYTPEELALFVSPVTAVHTASVKQLPAGSAELAASAQKHFAAREYDQAGADYQKILAQDTNNSIVLANLAAIEIEQGNYDSAANHLLAGLTQSPDDAYALTQLGNVRLHQKRFADALTALSRAVRIDSSNPESYNYLGVTLSSQGLRQPAEAALRKAVQLNPGYAPAHLNLANVYLDQQPPAPQLARWHYQKALAAGLEASPGIEKQLADLGAPVSR